MGESELYSTIPLALSRGGTRLFRFNSGMAWSGQIIKRTPSIIVLEGYHPVRLGPEGTSDIIGWTPSTVNGVLRALFTAIECKAPRKHPTEAQARFLELVIACGGRAGVARSVEDARIICTGT